MRVLISLYTKTDEQPLVRFLLSVNQRIVGSVQHSLDRLQLSCLDVLRASLDLHETFSCHIASFDLQQPHQIGLSKTPLLADSANILTDAQILFDLLLHPATPVWT